MIQATGRNKCVNKCPSAHLTRMYKCSLHCIALHAHLVSSRAQALRYHSDWLLLSLHLNSRHFLSPLTDDRFLSH